MLRIAKGATTEISVKKSRFISVLSHCKDADDLKRQKDALRSENPGARHVVHAAVFSNESLFSFSDDKEPKGTAGMPTLEVLKGTGVTNAVLFTVRYFGGTLLGTGGLKRAYSDSAKLCVENSEFEEVKEVRKIEFTAGYQDVGKLKKLFKDNSARIIECEEASDIRMSVEVECACYDSVKAGIEGILKRRI